MIPDVYMSVRQQDTQKVTGGFSRNFQGRLDDNLKVINFLW